MDRKSEHPAEKTKKITLRLLAILLAVIGIVLIVATVSPIIIYRQNANSDGSNLISPITENGSDSKSDVDYTQASNWFVGGAKKDSFTVNKVAFYTISIPKLKINDATVAIGGEDLSRNLIHYPGTALPGKIGNAVIIGHSVLPIFFNPKDYMTIFSTIPNLKKGDEIQINYDGIVYKYRVETKFEVLPTDLQVLDQDQTDSFITLVTCVPPGDPTKPKRLIVRARIVPLGKGNEILRN